MTLDEFMAANGINNEALAKVLKCGRERVRRLRLPAGHDLKRWPSETEWPLIVDFTKGAVTPNSQYGVAGDSERRSPAAGAP